jgi:hypothetical protein
MSYYKYGIKSTIGRSVGMHSERTNACIVVVIVTVMSLKTLLFCVQFFCSWIIQRQQLDVNAARSDDTTEVVKIYQLHTREVDSHAENVKVNELLIMWCWLQVVQILKLQIPCDIAINSTPHHSPHLVWSKLFPPLPSLWKREVKDCCARLVLLSCISVRS